MGLGYFFDSIHGFRFLNFKDGNEEDVILQNLQAIKSILLSVSENVNVLCFREESPIIKIPSEVTRLGLFEGIIRDIGSIAKDRNIRIASVIENPTIGLANKDNDVLNYARRLILSHCEFYELARMDYRSRIFIPYGDKYLCDYDRFKSGLMKLPKYVKHRLGIFDIDNHQSMAVAKKQSFPWIFDARKNVLESDLFKKSKESFVNNSISPGQNAIVLSDKEINDCAIDCILDDVSFPEMENKNATTNIYRGSGQANRSKKTSGSSLHIGGVRNNKSDKQRVIKESVNEGKAGVPKRSSLRLARRKTKPPGA